MYSSFCPHLQCLSTQKNKCADACGNSLTIGSEGIDFGRFSGVPFRIPGTALHFCHSYDSYVLFLFRHCTFVKPSC